MKCTSRNLNLSEIHVFLDGVHLLSVLHLLGTVITALYQLESKRTIQLFK